MKPNDEAASAACLNTDREIWREREGDAYADSIHVTEGGGIGINCGGMVFVKPIREWHRLSRPTAATGGGVAEEALEPPIEMVAAAQHAILKHPYFHGGPAVAFGFANAAVKAALASMTGER